MTLITRRLRPLAWGLACSVLALAGCHGKKASQSAAVGEILPGSASDAMIPLDSLRSRPPLAPPKEVAATGASLTRKKASATPDQSASPEAGAAPSPSATASAPTIPGEPVG